MTNPAPISAPSEPTLDSERRRALRAAAHHLNPVVSVSQKGLVPSVLTEIDRCLRAHELIKVRLYGMERDARSLMATEICTMLACAEVQQIGNLLVIWRPRDEAADSAITPRKSDLAGRRRGAPKTKKQAAAALENRRRRSG